MLVPDGERHGHVDGRPHVIGGDALVVAAVTSLHTRKPAIMSSMHQKIYILQLLIFQAILGTSRFNIIYPLELLF